MRLETNTTDRKTLAHAISEWIHEPVHYDGMPTCAYSIGSVKVERDGAVTCEDTDVWNILMPFFTNHGWMEMPTVEETGTPDSEAVEEIDRVRVSIPIGDKPPQSVCNIIRMVYARQDLIKAMTRCDCVEVDEEVITLLNDTKPESIEELEQLIRSESAVGMIKGIFIEDGNLGMEMIWNRAEPEGWNSFAKLLTAMADRALQAHHTGSRRITPAESEMKYFCRNWLMQLGMGGPDHKADRAVLLNHLAGFAAFRTADKMDAHKARCAEKRRSRHESGDNGNEADR